MDNLQQLRQPIERIINAISISLKLEVAVFDKEARLVCCTPTYLKKKGKVVHAPSIQEVLHMGSVVVNRPGQMPSCIGCRFRDNCPSTMEILACIKSGGIVTGVVTITSFTKEGYTRITTNEDVYLDAVQEIALTLGNFIGSKSAQTSNIHIDDIIQGMMEMSTHSILVADSNGVITQYNQIAKNTLKFCRLSASSLWHIIPEEIARQALRGVDFREKEFTKDNFYAKFTSKAIYRNDAIVAVIVRLSNESFGKNQKAFSLEHIIGSTPQTMSIHRLIAKVASSPSPILITGETGTGKELVARAIHEQSNRAKFPFVAVNCSGIPAALFESELFGYAEGSFTGAKKGGKIGKIEMAQGGTLFLDELGEMPLSMQPKLLRVLQEYEVERVGSAEKIPLDIRIIAATNCDLEEMMRQGKFRKDLFYRIGVVNIDLPPLRERQKDIMPIAMNYLEKLKNKFSVDIQSFSPEVEDFFVHFPWRGNVRELQNTIEYIANLCEHQVVTMTDLPKKLLTQNLPGNSHFSSIGSGFSVQEEEQLQNLMDKYGQTLNGKKKIAETLGISLRTLYRKMEKYQLK